MSYIHGKTLIKIAVAEDHVLLRETLCNIINTWDNCKVTMQADNGKQFLHLLDADDLPDLVLMDLYMPEMNGYDTIKILHEKFPELRIMVVSMYQSEEAILHLINMGVKGFFNKSGPPNEFKKAVHDMMGNGYYFADHATARLMKQAMASRSITLKKDLSEEELIFLKYITTEKTYQEIADGMKINLRHAEYLRDKMFDRFDVLSRVGLSTLAIKKGLVV